MRQLDTITQIMYDTPTSAKSDDEIGVSYIKSGISTHPVRKGVCFYARSLPTPCACLMVGCAGEQQCSPFLLSGTPILHNPSPFRLASFGDGNNHYQENQTMKALSFNGVTLTPVHHNSQIYLTSTELAKALGYADVRSITNIYNRNQDEFASGMTEVIKLITSNNSNNLQTSTRIFSLRGCHLIAMFARTPVAKDFRKWVLDILDKEVGKPVMTATAHTPKRKNRILTASDYTELSRIIGLMSCRMARPDLASLAIHQRLSNLCQAPSTKHIRYDQLGIVKGELARIERILQPYQLYRQNTEVGLIKRICLDDDDAVWHAIKQMDESASAYASTLSDYFCQTSNIARLGATA